MLGKKVALDLGTSSIRVLVRGEPRLIDEPAFVSETSRGARQSGGAALRAAAGDASVRLIRPLSGPGIGDADALQTLLTHVINSAVGRQRIFKPDVVAAVHSDCPGKDRRLILDILAGLGTRTAYLLDTPLAAAMGTGNSPNGPRGQIVLDIGGQNTEAALMAYEGRIAQAALGTGVEAFLDAVQAVATRDLGEDVTREIAVEILTHVVTLSPSRARRAEIRVSPGATMVEVSSDSFSNVAASWCSQLETLVRAVLAASPSGLAEDARATGLTVSGGGAAIDGLGVELGARLGFAVTTASEPRLASVRGAALAADSLDVLKRNFMYIR